MSKFAGLKPIVEPSIRMEPEAVPEKKVRPIGKRQDKARYQQISLYMERALYIEARRRIYGSGQDFSDLVNDLVRGWLGH